MLHHWHATVNNGASVRGVFVDIAKAFDHVDHNMPVAKLVSLGLPDIIVRWICDNDSAAREEIGHFLSDWLQLSDVHAAGVIPCPTDVRDFD